MTEKEKKKKQTKFQYNVKLNFARFQYNVRLTSSFARGMNNFPECGDLYHSESDMGNASRHYSHSLVQWSANTGPRPGAGPRGVRYRAAHFSRSNALKHFCYFRVYKHPIAFGRFVRFDCLIFTL